MQSIPYHYLGWGGRGESPQFLPNPLILASVPYYLLVSMGTSHWLTLIGILIEAVCRGQSLGDQSPNREGWMRHLRMGNQEKLKAQLGI